jgi:hypothetical protein
LIEATKARPSARLYSSRATGCFTCLAVRRFSIG